MKMSFAHIARNLALPVLFLAIVVTNILDDSIAANFDQHFDKNALNEATSVVTNLTIDKASNKLTQVATLARTYDAAGNTINDGAIQSLYSARNRLMQVNKAGVQANYSYNAFGERVSKLVGNQTTEFVYDESGHLLGEYRAADATEVVWLGDTPLAVIKPSASTQGGMSAGSAKVYFVQPDHLDTPRLVVNAANQPVWRWSSAPFGDTAANEQPTASLTSFSFNLRFPGQQFDVETGSHYNYFRDYEAGTGSYLQSDLLGLAYDYTSYRYVLSTPIKQVDRFGLAVKVTDMSGNPLYQDPNFAHPCPIGSPHQKGVAGVAAMAGLIASGVIPGFAAGVVMTPPTANIPPPPGLTGFAIPDGEASGIPLESKCGPCARYTPNQKQNYPGTGTITFWFK